MNAIEAENLSKTYVLRSSKDTSIKEFILKASFLDTDRKVINALDGISFSAKKGCTLGIIGGNGSGKSTLLKIIAGITEQTDGRLNIDGRVAALLELGAGFQPELSGLENLYLNGAILGISNTELDKKKDAIFDFAELSDFIHTPVKHYSSGMYVRLGFSIAVNLNPDILLVDEVLSVGDFYFQEKSFSRINEFRKNNKTIIFVTHNLEQAERICDEIIWLDHGKITAAGETQEIIGKYYEKFYEKKLATPPQSFSEDKAVIYMTSRLGDGRALIDKVRFLDKYGNYRHHFKTGEYLKIEIHYHAKEKIDSLDCRVGFASDDGRGVTIISASGQNQTFKNPPPPKGCIILEFDPLCIGAGKYLFTPAINPVNDFDNPYDLHLRYYEIRIDNDDESPVNPGVIIPAKFMIKE